jgi:type I restriction enzyme, R subunit
MSHMSKSERATQNRVRALLRDELRYDNLGNWADRGDRNSHIEEQLLTRHLAARYSPAQTAQTAKAAKALHKLRTEARHPNRALAANNEAVYALLRYGVPVQAEAGRPHETVQLIDWADAEKNHFAFAEEVTLSGGHERRPDIVLYLNGIAIGGLELKNSRVSVGEGIRQMPVEPKARVQRLVLQHSATRDGR